MLRPSGAGSGARLMICSLGVVAPMEGGDSDLCLGYEGTRWELWLLVKSYVALGLTTLCVEGVSQFHFTSTSRDLIV